MDDTRQRIVEATYACVSRSGLGKTTVEEVARQAEVSRATVYRVFPGGRDELIDAAVSWATVDFFANLALEVLQRVMLNEPEKLLPALTVESTRVRQWIAAFLTPYLGQRGVVAGVDPAEAADFLARMVLSYIVAPGRWDLDDPAQVAQLVRAELLAGVVPASPPDRGPA